MRVKHTAKVIKRSRKLERLQKRNKLIVYVRNSIMKMMPAYASSQATFLYKSKEK